MQTCPTVNIVLQVWKTVVTYGMVENQISDQVSISNVPLQNQIELRKMRNKHQLFPNSQNRTFGHLF